MPVPEGATPEDGARTRVTSRLSAWRESSSGTRASTKLLVVGKATKAEELDLVAMAKTAERFFTCSGSGSTASGILYLDQELTVVERRTGKVVHTRKLMADRVPCPTAETRSPLPGAAASRQAKAEVRESDVSKAVSELLGAGLRSAAPPKK